MKILAIETSCDESAIALLECTGDITNPSFTVLSSLVLSQAHKHAEFGGVYPNLAKREHSNNLIPILTQVLTDAGLAVAPENKKTLSLEKLSEILEREPELHKQLHDFLPTIKIPEIDAIAVTQGPGLEPALWVGINLARALSHVWNIPIIPTNHMEGHIVSVLVDPPTEAIQFPAIGLLVSGGHTQIIHIKNLGDYTIVGETRDDAIGEAFDKVARMLGLAYPGGPEIGRLAAVARQHGHTPPFTLPRPMLNSDDLDFSYSGLKTAVLYALRDQEQTDEFKQSVAREFEDAAFDVVLTKTRKALEQFDATDLIVGGGVIASKELRRRLNDELPEISIHLPDMKLTGDNAVMIGAAAYIQYLRTETEEHSLDVRAHGNLRLE